MSASNCEDGQTYLRNLICQYSAPSLSKSNASDNDNSRTTESFLSLTLRREREKQAAQTKLDNVSYERNQHIPSNQRVGEGDSCYSTRFQTPISEYRSRLTSNQSFYGKTFEKNSPDLQYRRNLYAADNLCFTNEQRHRVNDHGSDVGTLPAESCHALENATCGLGNFFQPDPQTEAKIRSQAVKVARHEIRKAKSIVSKEIDSMRQYFGNQSQRQSGCCTKLTRSASAIDSGDDCKCAVFKSKSPLGLRTRRKEPTAKKVETCTSLVNKKYKTQPKGCFSSNNCTNNTSKSSPSVVGKCSRSGPSVSRSCLNIRMSEHDGNGSIKKHSSSGRGSKRQSAQSARPLNYQPSKHTKTRALHGNISEPATTGRRLRSKSLPVLSRRSSDKFFPTRSNAAKFSPGNQRCSQRGSMYRAEMLQLVRQLDILGNIADELTPPEIKSMSSTVFSSLERLFLRVHGLDMDGSILQ